MGAGEFRQNSDPQVILQRFTYHRITSAQLVAEANYFDLAVPVDGGTDPLHGVGEVDEPGIGAEFFHVPGDFQDRDDVPGGMGESPGTAILSIGLADAVFQWDLPIGFPEAFPQDRLP